MKQADLAGSDFTKSYVSQVERGQTTPSLGALLAIAERLGRPASRFLGEHGDDEEHVQTGASLTCPHCGGEIRLTARRGGREPASLP